MQCDFVYNTGMNTKLSRIFRTALILILLSAGFPLPPVQALAPLSIQGPELVVWANPVYSNHRVPAPTLAPRRNALTAFNVTFLAAGELDQSTPCLAFPAEAQAAYLYAVAIWSTYLNPAQTIKIRACWKQLPTGALGSAGPYLYANIPGLPQSNVWYPQALIQALTGTDPSGGGYAITSRFTSDIGAGYGTWYFGLDGNPGLGHYDFVSVVLHEIGHGLGFTGSMTVSAGLGNYNLCTSGPSPFCAPEIYDQFTQNQAGTPLLNLPNNSAELAAALTSAAYFSGANTNAANGGLRAALYTPAIWAQGSSFSHLAESFNDTPNSLMTYSLNNGESVQAPGPVALGILADIGWSFQPTAPSLAGASAISASQIDLTWTDNSANESGFQVERSTNNATWGLITTTPADVTSYSNTSLNSGTIYYYRVRAASAGWQFSPYSNTASALTQGLLPAPSGLGATPASASQINLSWTDNSNSETGFQIERSTDSASWTLVNTTAANAVSFQNTLLTGGVRYYYRLRGVNGGQFSDYTTPSSAITSGAPPMPGSLVAFASSPTQVNLVWQDLTNIETGYKIERSTNLGVNWSPLVTTAANATSYTDPGRTPGKTYEYRVTTLSSQGNSTPAGPAVVVTWLTLLKTYTPLISR